MEAVGSLVDVDGKILRTLRLLFTDPARVTRDFLAGQRVSQAPPLRLFLAVVVIVFVVGQFAGAGGDFNIRVAPVSPGSMQAVTNADATSPWPAPRNATERTLLNLVRRANQHPAQLGANLLEWAQRLIVLLLPIGAALLGMLFAFNRRFVMFDHLIFVMHSLAVQGIILSLGLALSRLWSPALWCLLLLCPVHLFVHLRGAYGIGTWATLWRMAVLFVGSIIGLNLLIMAALVISLYEAGATGLSLETP